MTSSDVPNTTTRDITVTLTSGANTASEHATVAVVPVNDSPVLDNTVVVSLPDSTEYQGGAATVPVGPAGSLVSQLVGLPQHHPGNVTDPDGAGLTNGLVGTAPGIAVTAYSTTDAGGRSVGTWYFSTDNGTTWTAFPTTISPTRPLDLSPTARIAFQPNATDFNGQVPNAITFRAWDGFDGTANGTQPNLGGVSAFGQAAANNTAATAYSIATDTLPLMIDNVNNAPVAVGVAMLPPVDTTQLHPTGGTVAQLFNGGFTDPLDGQRAPGANPMGSVSNGFAGVAVTGNAATPAQGAWEYSVDGGHTWTTIPTNVSQSDAVILPGGARLAFLPAPGFSGQPGALAVNLIDSSNTAVAPGLTGAQLGMEGAGGVPLAALTGVDISTVGGSSAFSATTIALNTQVNPFTPVRSDAPVERAVAFNSGFPDDFTRHDPTGLQFWTGDDFLGRPLIPDISLVGSVANRFIIVEQHAVISVPPNIFQDSLPQAQLTYEAKLPDGSSLPSWITFNANDLTFSGTPPRNAYGRLEILIRARDVAGNTADATFNILIGRNQDDLVGLLKPGRHRPLTLPLHAGDPSHGLRQATAAWMKVAAPKPPAPQPPIVSHRDSPTKDADHAMGGAAQRRGPARGDAVNRTPPPAGPARGFSSDLHAAGPMSAWGRARGLLDKLEDLVRNKPAG